jgi:hypothetical protein
MTSSKSWRKLVLETSQQRASSRERRKIKVTNVWRKTLLCSASSPCLRPVLSDPLFSYTCARCDWWKQKTSQWVGSNLKTRNEIRRVWLDPSFSPPSSRALPRPAIGYPNARFSLVPSWLTRIELQRGPDLSRCPTQRRFWVKTSRSILLTAVAAPNPVDESEWKFCQFVWPLLGLLKQRFWEEKRVPLKWYS